MFEDSCCVNGLLNLKAAQVKNINVRRDGGQWIVQHNEPQIENHTAEIEVETQVIETP